MMMIGWKPGLTLQDDVHLKRSACSLRALMESVWWRVVHVGVMRKRGCSQVQRQRQRDAVMMFDVGAGSRGYNVQENHLHSHLICIRID